jgi:uncharacterized protein YbjT (DUF2867 family)
LISSYSVNVTSLTALVLFMATGNDSALYVIQPMAADDVASAVGRVATGSPLNGTIEVAGPERFRLDVLIRQGLSARDDPREVVADPHARYFGAELDERTLVPGDDAQLGETRLEDWLSRSTSQIPPTSPQPATVSAASIEPADQRK